MTVTGIAVSARHEPEGTELAADAPAGTTVLEVEWAGLFTDEGGSLELNGEVLDYLTADEDANTITLEEPLGSDATTCDRVLVVDGGQVRTDYVVEVDLGEGDPATVPIPFAQRDLWPEGDYDDPVPVVLSDDLSTLVDVPGRTPQRDASFIDPETTIPPAALTDGLAPVEPTVLSFIGGIGSVFFRWTEVANADPVTYRLHVNAGAAPATDGTHEVAAGVGLTAAAVRKLRDGTSIVGDGTVTYYGIVTVEDADGPGPASNTASGVPAQVTGPDIAVGSITAGLLVANDALLDALQATDINGVTITGSLVRTAAAGQRLEMDGLSATKAFKAYDAAGEQTVNIDGANNYVEGEFATAADGARVHMSFADGTGKVRFFGGTADELAPAGVYAMPAQLVISSPATEDQFISSGLQLFAGASNNSGQINVDAGQVRIGHPDHRFIAGTKAAVYHQLLDVQAMGSGSVGTGTFRDSVLAAVRNALGYTQRSRSAVQSIPNASTGTQVLWTQEDVVARNGVTYSAGTFTLPAGKWRVSTIASFAQNSAGRRFVRYVINGVNHDVANIPAAATGATVVNGYEEFEVAASTTLSVEVVQNSGGALDLGTATRITVAQAP